MLFLLPVNCSEPTVPRNGSIDPYQNTTVGAEIVFRCDQGFVPNGDMQAMCAANGSWTPDPATHTCNCESTHNKKDHLILSVYHYRTNLDGWEGGGDLHIDSGTSLRQKT